MATTARPRPDPPDDARTTTSAPPESDGQDEPAASR